MEWKRGICAIALAAVLASGCGAPIRVALGPQETATPTATLPPPTATPTPTASPTPVPPTPTPRPQTLLDEAAHWFLLGDYDQAEALYEQILSEATGPEQAAAGAYGLARIHYERGNQTEALAAFRDLASGYPGTPESAFAQVFLGQIYTALDRFEEAAQAYAAYLEQRPGLLDAYFQELVGDAYANAGQRVESNAAYHAALEADPLASFPEDWTEQVDLRIASNLLAQDAYAEALGVLQAVYDLSASDYTKAHANLLMGQAYLALDQPESAYERYQDSVSSYPKAYDSYSALLALLDAGIPVSELDRGLVDYFAGQHIQAVDAFDRYMAAAETYDGTALYYRGLALRELGLLPEAISNWQAIIDRFPADRFWSQAWEAVAETQQLYLDDPAASAETLLDFVAAAPDLPEAPDALFRAARNLERASHLSRAADVWEQLADSYPSAEDASRALFLAGVTRYRAGLLVEARTTFQRARLLSSTPADQSAALLWIGKLYDQEGESALARSAWQEAAALDPTGYYSERARELLGDRQPFRAPAFFDLAYALDAERVDAEAWLQRTFALEPGAIAAAWSEITQDARYHRARELWALGEYGRARAEYEALRADYRADAAGTFALVEHLEQVGLYRSAILAARHVLDLAGMDDAATLNAPVYFNHLRFGAYYREQVLRAAQEEDLPALLLFSVIRQESLFEGFARSGPGAAGLMQVMPGTGEGIAASLGWPEGYTTADLYRPVVSIRFGAHYLAQQLTRFEGDWYAALAAYNGGPGNALAWEELAPGDPDLFLEVVRITETRSYIMNIAEIYHIYRRLYERAP